MSKTKQSLQIYIYRNANPNPIATPGTASHEYDIVLRMESKPILNRLGWNYPQI